MDKEELKAILDSLERFASYYNDKDPREDGINFGVMSAVATIRIGLYNQEEVAK